jgi:exodeoxyribonuclease VII large subunit
LVSSSSSQHARQHSHHDSEDESQLGFSFDAPASREDTPRTWKIGELVAEARTHIERRFAELRVEGEISNLRAAPSGHLYFTLKDGEAQLPAVFFRRQASLLRFRPQDGMQVLLRGRLTIYEQRGQMQMVGETMEPLGAGSLQVAFEQLKARLKARGLFDAERKRPLPAYPRCVGIVTSPTGAVIRDFLNIVQRRHAALQVLLYPATVQGEGAAAEVAAGIAYLNHTREVDAIVIARGGGSLEDLAPFNTELLAEAIAASELPVVSAVGHETDFTIADFVADLRAPTPSAAAELITAAQHRVEEDLSGLSQRLERAMRFSMMQARHSFDRVRVEQMTICMMDALHRRQQMLDELSASAELAMRAQLQQSRGWLLSAQHALSRQDVVHRLHPMRERLERQRSALERAAQHYVSHRRQRLYGLEGKLRALSPMGVLERGYALVFDRQGHLVKSIDGLKLNEEITTRLADGNVTSTVRRLNKA